MCAVFKLKIKKDELRKIFSDIELNINDIEKNIYPLQKSPAITKDRVEEMIWGIKLSFTEKPMINTRSETVFIKFAEIAKNRCLIPISSFYEWFSDSSAKKLIELLPPKNELHFIAAVYDKDRRFSILTVKSVPQLANIHHRMPVILNPEKAKIFLKTLIIPPTITEIKPV